MSEPEPAEETRQGFWQRYPAWVLVLVIWFIGIPLAILAFVALAALLTSVL